MKRAIGVGVCLVGAIAAIAIGAHAQDAAFPKEKHPWLKWQTGSSVTYKLTNEMGGQKLELAMTSTLSEVSDAGYSVTTTTTFGGRGMQEMEKTSAPKKVGEEKVTVGDKELLCTVWEAEGEKVGSAPGAPSRKTTTKFFVAEEVPFPVKVVSDKVETVAISLSEKVTVAGREFDCVKLEGKASDAQGEGTMTVWASSEIPGGFVKMEMCRTLEGQAMSARVEATAFEAKP